MNTFGQNLRLTTFGESHGKAMGGIIDGFPSGFKIDFDALYEEISKRRPGSSKLVTARNEADIPEFLSGLSPEGITYGTPIGFIVRNTDTKSSDYDNLKNVFRPNHADYTYLKRYGLRDHRGGGRSSARETLNWVIGGAMANQLLESKGIKIQVEITQIGDLGDDSFYKDLLKSSSRFPVLSLSEEFKEKIFSKVEETKRKGDSIGGRITALVTGLGAGIGNPVADKLHSRLAFAMMSINAAKGFEYGIGFNAVSSFGSEIKDEFVPGEIKKGLETLTNYSGGIQGGISNGMPILFNVAFKPTPTLLIGNQKTVDIHGNPIDLNTRGRHDPCVAIRAVPVVKAMTALVIADFMV